MEMPSRDVLHVVSLPLGAARLRLWRDEGRRELTPRAASRLRYTFERCTWTVFTVTKSACAISVAQVFPESLRDAAPARRAAAADS